MKKVLVINSSPHRSDGVTGKAVEAILSVLKNKPGIDITVFNTQRQNVQPCLGCMLCRRTGNCRLEADDAHLIAHLISETDAVIIGAPTYWANMPGTLKLLLDRIVYALIRTHEVTIPQPLNKGKEIIYITSCTTPWPFNRLLNQSSAAIKSLKRVFKAGGFHTFATIQIPGTGKDAHLSSKRIKKISRIADRLATRL